jgi:tRNA uridine 5-carbamoylmethylation protein Kti12
MQGEMAMQNANNNLSETVVDDKKDKNRMASQVILLARNARHSRKDLERVLAVDAHRIKSLFHGNLKSISTTDLQSWMDALRGG